MYAHTCMLVLSKRGCQETRLTYIYITLMSEWESGMLSRYSWPRKWICNITYTTLLDLWHYIFIIRHPCVHLLSMCSFVIHVSICHSTCPFYRAISNEPVLNTPWSSGSDDSWDRMRADFRQLAPEMNSLGDKSKLRLEDEVNGFSESVSLFIDLLSAYQVRYSSHYS